MMDPSITSRIGLAVIHDDGDAGVITGFEDEKWQILFCSGYKGNFPSESVQAKDVFAWFPSKQSEALMPDLELEDKLALLCK